MKIILLSHMFTNGNLGVGALSIANLLIISEACESIGIKPKFYLFGYKAKKVDYSFELQSHNIDYEIVTISYKKYILNFFKIYKIFKSSDVVFDIGQGDSFADIYGNKRFISIIIPEFFSLFTKTPLVLAPQTIGPFKSKFAKISAKYILTKSKVVFARDHKSYLAAEELMQQDKNQISSLKETVDVAMLLPYQKNKDNQNNKILVGLNVSALLFHGGYTQNNQFSLMVNYRELMAMIIEYFKSLDNVELVLVAHVLEYEKDHIENDFEVCSILGKKYGIKVAPFFKSPIEAKSYISQFDFFMGARMHATIAAFSSGVAVTPMAYSRKFEGLYNSLDYNYLVDMTKKNTNESFELVVNHYNKRDELQEAVINGKQKAIEKLDHYKQTVKDILHECKSSS